MRRDKNFTHLMSAKWRAGLAFCGHGDRSGESKTNLDAAQARGICRMEVLSPEFEGAGKFIQRDILSLDTR